jgi:hypothetical protein
MSVGLRLARRSCCDCELYLRNRNKRQQGPHRRHWPKTVAAVSMSDRSEKAARWRFGRSKGSFGPSTSFMLASFAQMLRRIQVQLWVENNRLQISVSCKQRRTKESATRGSSCISMTILNSQFRPKQLRGCSLTNRKSAFNKAGAAL